MKLLFENWRKYIKEDVSSAEEFMLLCLRQCRTIDESELDQINNSIATIVNYVHSELDVSYSPPRTFRKYPVRGTGASWCHSSCRSICTRRSSRYANARSVPCRARFASSYQSVWPPRRRIEGMVERMFEWFYWVMNRW